MLIMCYLPLLSMGNATCREASLSGMLLPSMNNTVCVNTTV